MEQKDRAYRCRGDGCRLGRENFFIKEEVRKQRHRNKECFMDKSVYQKYLASREWAILKRLVRERSDGKCERCLVGGHDATHHLTYERIGREDPEDLQAVCSLCHAFLSGKSEQDPRLVIMEKVQRTIGILRDIEPDALFAIELLRALGEENLANRMKKTADVIADIKDRIFGFLVELDCEGDE
jgi:hypothetical protein